MQLILVSMIMTIKILELKLKRPQSERLKNIATIGVKTYGWTFANRGLETPTPQPKVELLSPNGSTWTWNNETEGELVSGSAVEFCQVVTQVRNIKDTNLQISGENATKWMEIAQCFAGPPEDPPEPGSRTWDNTNKLHSI